MLYRKIIAVCSQIHIKHINTLCGQNVELLNVKLVVHVVTTRPQWAKFQVRQCTPTALASYCCTVRLALLPIKYHAVNTFGKGQF